MVSLSYPPAVMKPSFLTCSFFALALLWLLTLSPCGAQTAAEHRLGPGDTVVVKVYQEADLDTSAVLSREGKLALPLVGQISLQGMTNAEAARAIEAAYRNGYLVKPSVTVTTGAMAKKRFSIQGQVVRPGPFFFPDGERVTLMQAIGFAGGYTRIANPSKVTIIRGGMTIKVDAKKLTKSGGAVAIYLFPGHVVNFPEGW